MLKRYVSFYPLPLPATIPFVWSLFIAKHGERLPILNYPHFLYHYLLYLNKSGCMPHSSTDTLFKFISNLTLPDLIIYMQSSSCPARELYSTQLISQCFGNSGLPGLNSPLILLLSSKCSLFSFACFSPVPVPMTSWRPKAQSPLHF